MPKKGPGNDSGGGSDTPPPDPHATDPRVVWAEGFLKYIGAPASGPDDQRVQWLVAWQDEEATWDKGNQFNPLSITGTYNMKGEGSWNWNNGDPVQTFATAEDGYNALVQYLSNPNDEIILNAFKNDRSTVAELQNAVVNSNWNGGGVGGAMSQLVAHNISVNLGNYAGATDSTAANQSPYTGAVAFTAGISSNPSENKWDLSAIPPSERQSAYDAIQKYLDTPGLQSQVQNKADALFGYDAWLLNDPVVKTIVIWGSLTNQSNNAIFGALYNSEWWKTTDANQRYFEAMQGQDPATTQNAINGAAANIEKTAAAIGVPLSASDIMSMAKRVASLSMGAGGTVPDSGFTQDQITRMITAQYNYKTMGTTTGGDVSTLADDYGKLAGEYLVGLSPQAIGAHVQATIRGDYGQPGLITGAESGFENYLKKQAISRYPYMAEQINAGITPQQWIDPYAQDAAQILEKNPNEMNFTNPTQPNYMGFALDQRDAKTGEPTPMSLSQFKQELMSNPKYGYQYTNQANTQAWTEGSQLLSAMGAVPAPIGF